MSEQKVSGAILAGGKSLRMGRNKAFLPAGGETFLRRAVGKLEPYTEEIMISTGPSPRYTWLGLPVVSDAYPEGGALAGIEACLGSAEHDLVFFLPLDMPFAPVELIPRMVELAGGMDGAVPSFGGFYEPLFAVYRKSCLPAIRSHLERGERKVRSFYPDVHLRIVGSDILQEYGDPERMFLNVNTLEDYQKYREWMSHE